VEILVLSKNEGLGIDKSRESLGYMGTYMLRECVEVIRAVHQAEYMGEDFREVAG
jgi:hypothetical protein